MSTFGIICEFNPLHNGHKRLIDAARKMGAERIVCVMSGNAVQRGELAIIEKYDRAKAAVLCGADLVLELPFPWCAASAEYFARTGVEILSHFCDTIIFGSECGSVETLKAAATAASGKAFRAELQQRLQCGEGAAQAYFSMLERDCEIDLSSNDLLGIEYIRAIIERGYDLNVCTVKREGIAYSDRELEEGSYPSASAIRTAWSRGERTEAYLPREASEVFEVCQKTDIYRLSEAILLYYRCADAESLSRFAELEGGLANRIVAAAKESVDLNGFFERLRTKRYTDAKLRRGIIFGITGVTHKLLKDAPQYVMLLGANERGRAILSECRKSGCLNIVTKPADAPRESGQFAVNERLDSVFYLARAGAGVSAEGLKRSAFIK